MSERGAATLVQLASQHSASCFFNSLLREWSDHHVINSDQGISVCFPLGEGNFLQIPLNKKSCLGRHQYTGEFYLQHGETLRPVDFEMAMEQVVEFLARSQKTSLERAQVFKNRVLASRQNILESLEFRSEMKDLSFKECEQGLMIGHNFHPTPKSRDEFDSQDHHRYSPELGASFSLVWLAADPTVLHQKSAASFREKKWTEELALQELPHWLEFLPPGMIPVPMHPWQIRQLKKNLVVQDYIKKRKLIELGTSQTLWSATSSLRSLYNPEAPYMLKFSMSVKVTNSVRHLLVREVERGLQLHEVLETEKGQKFSKEHPDFKIITEPAYFCLKTAEGEAIPESIVVCRENPFTSGNAAGQVVLATLVQDAPYGGPNLIESLLKDMESDLPPKDRYKKWFSDYLQKAVKPLILAQAEYGFLVGAHQQNLILNLKNGWPVAACFRDCQGTGYSELGYQNFAQVVTSITRDNGNVLDEKMGNYLFAYYLIINSTFNVMAALAASDVVTEQELLCDLREFLRALRRLDLKDVSCLDYLLQEEFLMHKGNFLCAFQSVNENTSENPLAIYAPMENPIKEGPDA